MKRWPLLFMAAPAAVAVWSGWVGLGELCGFGVIHPLPGIMPGVAINTAITLPIGVEAYGTYALGAWLRPAGIPAAARTFARRSAVGALTLGAAGQITYHLLAAAHAKAAPWPVVVLVSVMPVVMVGLAVTLMHLLHPAAVPGVSAEPSTVSAGSDTAPEAEHPGAQAARIFKDEIAARTLPSIRRIRAELHCGQPKAREAQAYLRTLIPAS